MRDHPKALIESLSEELLETFRKTRLLDPYDVYQHLMNYWAETMQDDLYVLVEEGWTAVLDGKPNTDLIPQPLIVTRYFAEEHALFDVDDRCRLTFGDTVELTPGYAPTTVNLYDAYHVVEKDVVVDIWPIIPRGAGHCTA